MIACGDCPKRGRREGRYLLQHVEDGDLEEALGKIGRSPLDDLDGDAAARSAALWPLRSLRSLLRSLRSLRQL